MKLCVRVCAMMIREEGKEVDGCVFWQKTKASCIVIRRSYRSDERLTSQTIRTCLPNFHSINPFISSFNILVKMFADICTFHFIIFAWCRLTRWRFFYFRLTRCFATCQACRLCAAALRWKAFYNVTHLKLKGSPFIYWSINDGVMAVEYQPESSNEEWRFCDSRHVKPTFAHTATVLHISRCYNEAHPDTNEPWMSHTAIGSTAQWNV